MNRPTSTMGIRGSQGRLVDLASPDPASFQAEEVARALANENRYAGNYGPYSVAQHSVLVARMVERMGGEGPLCLAGVHHDDSEAVTGDVPRPVKNMCPDFRALEARLEAAVAARWGVDLRAPIVKAADMAVFKSEVYCLVPPDARWIYEAEIAQVQCGLLPYQDFIPWGPDRAFAEYMDAHVQYGGGR